MGRAKGGDQAAPELVIGNHTPRRDSIGVLITRRVVQSLCVLSCATATAQPAYAVDLNELKKEVFSNCGEAAQKAAELTADEEAEFLSYLSRILAMPSANSGQLMSHTAPLPGAPNAPVGPIRDLNLWQTFEPTRELEAKQCALELLHKKMPAAVEVVPDMLEIAAEKNATFEYRQQLLRTAWKITVETGKTTFRVPTEKLRRLLEQVTVDNNGYAENVLIELHASSLPLLAAELRTPDSAKRARVREILLAIDPDGPLLGPVLTPLLDSADDGLRTEVVGLLGMLPQYDQALPIVLSKLGDPSPDVVDAVYSAIQKICERGSAISGLKVDEQQLRLILQEFQRGAPEDRAVLEPILAQFIRNGLPGAGEGVRAFFRSTEGDLKRRALRLSALNADTDLYQIFSDALYDDSVEVRIGAIEALEMLPARTAESSQLLLRLLKSVSGEKDVEARERLILQIAKAVNAFPVDQSMKRMTPYFIDALGFKNEGSGKPRQLPNVEQAAGGALVKLREESVPPLVKSLKSSAPVVRRRALETLFKIRPLDKKTLRSFIDLFKDRDAGVREALMNGLAELGGEGILIARDALRLPELLGRATAARLLLKINVNDAAIPEVLSQALAGFSCRDGVGLAPEIIKLEPGRRQFVENKVLDCISGDESARSPALDALAHSAPLSPQALNRVEELLKDQGLPAEFRLRIAQRSSELGLPPEKYIPLLLELLSVSDNSLRNRVVSLLGEVGQASIAAVPDLKRIVGDSNEEPLIQNRAVLALTRIQPSEVNYIDYLMDEMRGDRYQWAQSALKDLPVEQLLPFLRRALAELPDDRKALAARAAGRLGAAGQPLAEDLLRLFQSEDATLRYQACVSMLRIEPARAEVVQAVRAQLVGKNRRRFIVEKLPEDALQTIRTILQNSESFVERRAAEEILKTNPTGG